MTRVTESRIPGSDGGLKDSNLAISVCVYIVVVGVWTWPEICGVLRLEAFLSLVANRNRICNGRSSVTINGNILYCGSLSCNFNSLKL